MLLAPDAATSRRIQEALRYARYTEDELVARFKSPYPPAPGTPRWYRVEAECEPGSPFGAFVSWFFLGAAVREEAIPFPGHGLLDELQVLGLLQRSGGWIAPRALLVPVREFWVASDRLRPPPESPPHGGITRGDLATEEPSDPVLGVGPAPLHLDRFCLTTPVDSVLDLCCGGGILALSQRASARRLAAADLSERGLDFARFNLALNGATDGAVDFLHGDLFDAVKGRRFDRIVCNPPFVLGAAAPIGLAADVSHRPDAPLDAFCERIVREAPRHLEPDGTLHMMFEWPELEGEDWRDRLAAWARGSGCDAWFVHANRQSVAGYVESRAAELARLTGAPELGPLFRHWVASLRGRGVVAIHGGFLLLRRREGARNWIRFEELDGELRASASRDLERALARFDRLEAGQGADDPLDALLLAPAPTLVVPSPLAGSPPLHAEGTTDPRFVTIEAGEGWRRRVILQAEIAKFLERFHGGARVAETVRRLADDSGVAPESIDSEVRRVVRLLVEKGFLEPVG